MTPERVTSHKRAIIIGNVNPQKFNGQAVHKKVVVHSYVEVRMYLLHKISTKPKLRESCFSQKQDSYYTTTQKTLLLEFCYSTVKTGG